MQDEVDKVRWKFIVRSGLPPNDILQLSEKDLFKLIIAYDKFGEKGGNNGR